jgi:hypothetical protein
MDQQPLYGQQIQNDPLVTALMQGAPMPQPSSMVPSSNTMALAAQLLKRNDPNNPDGVSGNKLFGFHYTGALPAGMSPGQSDAQVPLNQGY